MHTTARGKVKGRVKGKVKTNAKGEKHRKDDGKGMARAPWVARTIARKIAQATLGRSGDEHSAVCEVPPSRRLYIKTLEASIRSKQPAMRPIYHAANLPESTSDDSHLAADGRFNRYYNCLDVL